MISRCLDCSITSGSWVAQTTAAPVSRARRASRIATAIAFAPSSREVGSSASSTSGRVATARAIATRARSPCERRPTRWVARSDRARPSRAPRARRAASRRRARGARARARRSRARRGAGRGPSAGRRRRSSRGGAARAPRGRAPSARRRRRSPCRRAGSSSPASRCSSVVLPEPDGPVTACRRPGVQLDAESSKTVVVP